eukprot:COSAG01_NODE_5525_length_4205_cov_68.353629_3_plen_48_part_00
MLTAEVDLGEPAINYLLEDSWLDSKRLRAFLGRSRSADYPPPHPTLL